MLGTVLCRVVGLQSLFKGPCLLTPPKRTNSTRTPRQLPTRSRHWLEIEAAPVIKTKRFRLPSAPLPEAQGEAVFAAGIIGIGLSALVGAVGGQPGRRIEGAASGARLLSQVCAVLW